MDIMAERVPLEVMYATEHFGLIASIAANAHAVHEHVAASLPSGRFVPPASSYTCTIMTSVCAIIGDPAEFILERPRVAVSAAPTFGGGGEGFIRLNVGTCRLIPTEVLSRITRSLP